MFRIETIFIVEWYLDFFKREAYLLFIWVNDGTITDYGDYTTNPIIPYQEGRVGRK